MTTLLNPKSPNLMPTRSVETPIWCALLAGVGDSILDNNVEPLTALSAPLIVVMGSNPSTASTDKMPEVEVLKSIYPDAKITGLHPMAMGTADVLIPHPKELVKIKRARWDLLDMSKYIAHNWHCLQDIDNRGNYAALYTSYGCPFDCNFCNIHAIYPDRKVYFRDPTDVIAELTFLYYQYGTHNVKFCDELFTLNPHHVATICSGIKDLALNIWAYARVGTVTYPMLVKMKDAGINWLAYGFESADENVLKGVGKTYKGLMEAVEMTKSAGINIMGNFIFGLPNETLDSMFHTLELAEKLQCEFVNFYVAKPYPGSKLYDGNTDWKSYNQYGNSMSPAKRFRDYAFTEYFSDPQYQSMIRKKFGFKAVSHIREMLSSPVGSERT